jgi:hypothetical protein
MSIYLSLSAHQSEPCLVDQCLNYLIVGKIDKVVVHINPLSTFNVDLFNIITNYMEETRNRVIINPYQSPLYSLKSNERLTSVLHRAHILNYLYIRECFDDIETICLDSSNSLLIRPGLSDYIADKEAVSTRLMEPDWLWRPMVQDDLLTQQVGVDNIRFSQHEGTFFKKASFDKICAFISKYELALQRQGKTLDQILMFPREEVLFSTGYCLECGDKEVFPPYIWMPWERELAWSVEDVAQIFSGQQPCKDYHFGIKRVARDINDPVRMYIGDHLGYRPRFLEALRNLGVVSIA